MSAVAGQTSHDYGSAPPTASVPHIPAYAPARDTSDRASKPVTNMQEATSSKQMQGANSDGSRVARQAHLGLWRRIFGRSAKSGSGDNSSLIQQKNTFVHFEDPKPVEGQPPAKSAPGAFAAVPPPASAKGGLPSLSGACPRTTSSRSVTSVASSFHSSVASNDSEDFEGGVGRAVVLANDALDRTKALGGGQAKLTEEMVQLSQVVAVHEARLGSIGSKGHATNTCMPCLMQVRWNAGKCQEPCKFGPLCGRCHEPHTEEQLQKIQAKMRKQKKRLADDKIRSNCGVTVADATMTISV